MLQSSAEEVASNWAVCFRPISFAPSLSLLTSASLALSWMKAKLPSEMKGSFQATTWLCMLYTAEICLYSTSIPQQKSWDKNIKSVGLKQDGSWDLFALPSCEQICLRWDIYKIVALILKVLWLYATWVVSGYNLWKKEIYRNGNDLVHL